MIDDILPLTTPQIDSPSILHSPRRSDRIRNAPSDLQDYVCNTL
jgi:hypothetical protein